MKAMKKTVGILSLVIMLLSQIFTPLTYAATGDNEDNPVIPEVLDEQEADIDEPENPVEKSGIVVNPEQIIQDVISGGNTVVTTGGTTQEEVSDKDTEESIKDDASEKTDESEGTVTIENNMLVDAVEAGFGGELEYNSEEVRGYKEYKNVKVEVYAETGAFEETPSLLIEPLESEKETDIKKAILTYNEDTESLDEEEIEQVAEEKITEVVAFDIKFLDKEKKEVQPREGMVRVEFNFTENKTLEETEEHEIKVYHLDNKDEKGNEIKEIEKMQIDEPEMTENNEDNVKELNEEQILTVIGEKFSIYTIVQQVREEGIQATTEDQLANFVYGEISIARPDSLSLTEYPIEGLTIMDRNLGAISNDITDSNSYGYQYQWGNNYGFITSLSQYQINKDNNKIDISGKTGYAGSTFIYGYNTWMNENTGGFWGGENDIAGNKWGALLRDSVSQEKRQGPCPKGWHVPSAGERGLLIKYWGTSDANAILSNESNYLIKMNAGLNTNTDKFKQDFKLPTGNSRYRSDARNDGYGKYWSSTPRNGGDGYAYYFNLTNTDAGITTSALAYTNGYQVRCFKNTYTPGTLHTITFNFNDGKGSTAVINVLDGMTGVIPETPVKSYNKFLGWYLQGETTPFDFENSPITEDIQLNAKFEPIKITFDANGGTFENQQETKTINYEYVEIPWMAGTQTQPDTINVPGAKNILLNLTVGCFQHYYVTLSGAYNTIKAPEVHNCPGSTTGDYLIYGNTVDIIGAGYVGYGGKAFSMPENPVQEGKGFKGWFTEDGEKWTIGYDDKDVTVYAHWGEPIATFIKGEQFNEKIKKLSNQGENITYDDPDENILEIKRGSTVPDGVNTIVVSTIDSEVPIEVWFDNGILYYYSEAKTIYLNEITSGMFSKLNGIKLIDLSNFNASKLTSVGNMFNGSSYLERIILDGWDLSHITGISGIFSGTPSLKYISMSGRKIPENFTTGLGRSWGAGGSPLEEIDVTNWDLSITKNLNGVLAGNPSLQRIKGLETWNTTSVTIMSSMFQNSNNLRELDLSHFNTENVTKMDNMFYGCASLTGLDLSNFETQNVTDFGSMFCGASSLNTLNLDGWNLRKSSIMGGMFSSTSSLRYISMSGWKIPATFTHGLGRSWSAGLSLEEIDVTNWDLSNTTSLEGLFADSKIQKIKGLETWDTSNISNMSQLFHNCINLSELDLSSFDTSNVINTQNMFYQTKSLTTIYVSGGFVNTNFTNISMFDQAINIKGGNGTTYNHLLVNGDYARIDGGEENPGYFTNILDKPYTITYELNNGTGENRTGYTSRDDTFTLNNPTREGYTFLGWTGSNLTEPTVDVEIVNGTKGNLHFTANWKLIENTVISTPSSSGKGRVLPSKQKATTEEQEHNAADEKAVTETESNNESENNQEDGSLSQSEDNSAIYTPSQSVTVKQQVRKIASKTLTRGEVAVMTNVLIDVFPQLLTDKQEIKDNNECISFADEANFTSAEKSAATRLCKLGIMGIHSDTKEQLDKFEAKKNATNNEFTMVIDRLLSSNNDKEISTLRNALKDRKNNEEGVKFRTVLESFIKIKNAIKK